ncbi:MAG: c-type cytochrome [Chloroflexi bacterium]|nr:c-type cytochrome [Chloroflexota bacterium]
MSTKNLLRIVGIALLGLSLWLASAPTGVAQANPSLDAAAGKAAWDAKGCKSCHGANAEGKVARALAAYEKTADDIIKQVRTPRNQMPAFSTTQVTDQQLKDMFDYFKSLPAVQFTFTPYQPKAGEDPGKTLFNQKRCSACHGENAERIATLVTGQGRKTISEAEVLKQVRTPRANMPTFRAEWVTDADVSTIAKFLKVEVEKAAAPATLPKSGSDSPVVPDASPALVALIGGLAALGASFVMRRRTNI